MVFITASFGNLEVELLGHAGEKESGEGGKDYGFRYCFILRQGLAVKPRLVLEPSL